MNQNFELNDEQYAALEEMDEYAANGDQKFPYVLNGLACSGKTVVLSHFSQRLEDTDRRAKIGTLTGKAASVIHRKTGRPAVIQKPVERDTVKKIADDIASAVAEHIERMYPNAVKATSKNMLRSVRGCVFNEIMSALSETDENAILARLADRKARRRALRATYRRIRETDWESVRDAKDVSP